MIWDCGSRKYTQAQGEHAKITQKGPSRDWNHSFFAGGHER